jgi:hypothetical protein
MINGNDKWGWSVRDEEWGLCALINSICIQPTQNITVPNLVNHWVAEVEVGVGGAMHPQQIKIGA